MAEHFAALCDQLTTAEGHYFAQLKLDLELAGAHAKESIEDQGASGLTALEQAFTAIAAQRWSRFKQSEGSSDQARASEMKAFSQFWYDLVALIDQTKWRESGGRGERDF